MGTNNQSLVSVSISEMQDYLETIGFQLCAELETSLAYRHVDTGTIVTLTKPLKGDQIRSADFLSIRTRLEIEQLVPADAIAIFDQGRLPIAS